MTRKDYVKAAAIIRSHECPPAVKLDYLAGWNSSRNELAARLAAWFAADNPAFDRARFMAACGLED